MDGAILVVAATDGPMPQTREHIFRTSSRYSQNGSIHEQSGYDGIDDAELEVEMEIERFISFYEYDGDNGPVAEGVSVLGENNIQLDHKNY